MSAIRRELGELHPIVRDAVKAVLARLEKEKIPFKVFEAYRMPGRQRALFNQGRSAPGPIVTKQDAWGSFHQYGMAADFVLFENGKWSWDDSGSRAAWWRRLHEIGKDAGLVPVSFEMPHLQLAGYTSSMLRAGNLPPGDKAWMEVMQMAAQSWPDGAPPLTIFTVDKPPLEGGPASAEAEASPAGHTSGTLPEGGTSLEDISRRNFERAQEIIREYEGGYVHDPHDPGGATNFGITHKTLAAWRKVASVTPADVKAMSYAEAKDIYKAMYWDRNACGRMPGTVGLVVYNIGVHCGTATGAAYLQRALNKNGASLKIDSDIGNDTLTALATAPHHLVAEDMVALYEERLRGHPNFKYYENGFMNRVRKLRKEVELWEADLVADTIPPSPDTHAPQDGATDMGNKLELTLKKIIAELSAAIETTQATQAGGATAPAADGALGPVNGALGSTIGELLNGKKSAIGILGALVTSLFSNADANSTLGKIGTIVGEAVPILAGSGGSLLPIFLSIAAWGFMGRMEKWAGQSK